MRTLVLERGDVVGGAAITTELSPGRTLPLAHNVGRLRPSIWRDLDLKGHGLRLVSPHVVAFAPSPDGTAITLSADVDESATGIGERSTHDGERYVEFDRQVRSIGRFLAELGEAAAGHRGARARRCAARAGAGTPVSCLGRHDGRTVLRVLPMAVADFVAEAFETDACRPRSPGVAAYTAMGPWSASTCAVLLGDLAGNDGGPLGPPSTPRAVLGADHCAGCCSPRRRRRDPDGCRGRRDPLRDGRATGVVLAGGDEIEAHAVVSAIDPKRTLTGLVDPAGGRADAALAREQHPHPGWSRRSTSCCRACRRSPRRAAMTSTSSAGGSSWRPASTRWSGRSTPPSTAAFPERPVLEATIPSLADPSLVARAPAGTQVMSVIVQYTPYALREGTWDERRDQVGDTVLATLDEVAPGLSSLVTARQVLTLLDLERDFGLTGGHPLHAEPGLDQFFLWRPLLGHARYRFGLDGLYLAGSGAHPGGGVTGQPGKNAAREILSDFRKRRS